LTAVLKIAQARLAAPTIEQFAAAHMMENIPDSYFAEVRRKFVERRDALDAALKQIPGVSSHKPKGAFYTFARLPVADVENFAAFMLDKFTRNGKTTFIAPGSGFYMQNERGRQEARFAYVLEKNSIEDAVETLAAGLVQYGK
jgi:aspartate aminotransferase